MRTFGVPTENIPLTYCGAVKTKNAWRLFKVRSSIDKYRKSKQPFPHAEYYELNSVVFGKRGKASHLPGNAALNEIIDDAIRRISGDVDDSSSTYSSRISDFQREMIATTIMEEAKELGLVYIEYNKRYLWYEDVTNVKKILKVITQTVRDRRKRPRNLNLKAKRIIVIKDDDEDEGLPLDAPLAKKLKTATAMWV